MWCTSISRPPISDLKSSPSSSAQVLSPQSIPTLWGELGLRNFPVRSKEWVESEVWRREFGELGSQTPRRGRRGGARQTGSRVWGWGAAELKQPPDAREWVRKEGRFGKFCATACEWSLGVVSRDGRVACLPWPQVSAETWLLDVNQFRV